MSKSTLSSGLWATFVFLLSLLFISVVFHFIRSASPDIYFVGTDGEQNETSQYNCATKLQILGYDIRPQSTKAKNTEEQKRYYDICLQVRSAEATEKATTYAGKMYFWTIINIALVAMATISALGAFIATLCTLKLSREATEAAWNAVEIEKLAVQANVEVKTVSVTIHGRAIWYGQGVLNRVCLTIEVTNTGYVQALVPKIHLVGSIRHGDAEPAKIFDETKGEISALNGRSEDVVTVNIEFEFGLSSSIALECNPDQFNIECEMRATWFDHVVNGVAHRSSPFPIRFSGTLADGRLKARL